MIELFPEELDVDKFVLLLSFDRIPTLKKYEFGVMAEHLEWQGDDGRAIPAAFSELETDISL